MKPCKRTFFWFNPATGAGLIITEASQISPMAQGYLDTPGIHSAEQVAAWRTITDAVHAEGGKIVVQLWHVGRISHSSLLPGGAAPVSSTSQAAKGKTFTTDGFVVDPLFFPGGDIGKLDVLHAQGIGLVSNVRLSRKGVGVHGFVAGGVWGWGASI